MNINIRDLHSLEQLRIAIIRFFEDNESHLFKIDSKLQSRIGDLKALELQFQRQIELARDDLQNANSALSNCESNTYEDEDGETVYPDCDYEREDVIACKKHLAHTEHNYNSFRREIRNLEISVSEYQNAKLKYKTLIQFERESGTNSLKQLVNGAENYLSISSPMENGFSNGFGLAETIAKADPTMILATVVGVGELMIMTVFAFVGLSGTLFSVSNSDNRVIITTTFFENGDEHICSQLKIERKETGNFGKILSVNIPPSLQNEKIGKHLINNMEATCRANDCKEISGWANSNNVGFYQGLNYQTRNEIKEAGAEVFKPLESNFYSSQQNAKAAFENSNNRDFIKNKNLGKQPVNPLYIISPDEMNDEKFWGQHGENQTRYFDLIEKYELCNREMENGKTLDQIRMENMWVANAYDVFNGLEPIRLLKSGNYYRIDSNGRHRVAAAQMYYLQTGKTIPLTAEVLEKD